MIWKIDFSKVALKFIIGNNIPEAEIENNFKKVIQKLSGQNVNIDIKRLKGKWQGYYRLREGKIRIIFEINFEKYKIYIDRINSRGDVYK